MAELPRRQLGRTGLQVTMLGYGAMELRGAPRGRDVTDQQAGTILHAVLDAGINYIDTSIDYGVSEERIGRYIGDRRSEYYLASKCGCLVGAPPAPRGQTSPHVFTRDNILKGVEQSLVRMRTDHLDVLQFHISPSPQTLENDGALETVLELKRTGTTRFVGMSGTLPNLVDHIAMGVFDVFQIPYSAVEREHEAVIAAAARAGAGIVIRGGAAKGAPTEGKHEGVQWDRWQKVDFRDLLDEFPSGVLKKFLKSPPSTDLPNRTTVDLRIRPLSILALSPRDDGKLPVSAAGADAKGIRYRSPVPGQLEVTVCLLAPPASSDQTLSVRHKINVPDYGIAAGSVSHGWWSKRRSGDGSD